MTGKMPLEADYIIVGGGTAGLVLASRLSEDPDSSVLVLEAGKDLTNDPRISVPATWTTLLGSDADWQFQTTRQSHLNDRIMKTPQGKLLGGSSGINGLTFLPPGKAIIDTWETLGAEGWNWDNLQPYFKKCCTLQLPDSETQKHIGVGWIDKGANGDSGPLKVGFPATKDNSLAKAWIDTFESLEIKTVKDPFSGSIVGAFSNLATVDVDSKTRSYAATAYALPAATQGAKIVTEAVVNRILFDAASDESEVTATGVEAVVQGQTCTIHARKEVILCAGALNTPKLLELSGIGDEKLLRDLDNPVIIHNANVGENLQDHLTTSISFETVDGVETMDDLLRADADAIQTAMNE